MSTVAHAHHHHEADEIDVFGFWIYILTDCVLFATLFAAYLVLHSPGGMHGPSLKQYIELPYVLKETFFLLGSNFTFGLAILSLYRNNNTLLRLCLLLTFILGAGFVVMEINEFIHLHSLGYSWTTNAAASSFFVLVE